MSTISSSLKRDPLILPFYLPTFVLAIASGLLAPVLPLYAKDLDASYARVGLVLAGEAVGMLLGDVPAGVLVRGLGQKRTLMLGVACTGLATAALFAAPTVWAAVLLRVVAGFGRALFGVAQHAYVAGVAAVGRRGRSIALFGGLNRIGRFFGPLAGGILAASFGLRSTFLAFGAMNVLVLAAVAAFVPTTPGHSSASEPVLNWSRVRATLKERYRILAAAGGGQLLAQTIRAGRGAVIPLYAADVIGLDVRAIGLIVSLASAVDMSLFYPAGWIMDHLGRKRAIVPSFLIQAVGMALIPLTSSFGTLLGAAALVGFGNGIGSGSMMTLGADLAPKETRGEFLGLWRLVGDGGHTLGPIIVGQVADLLALSLAPLAIAGAGVCAGLVFGLFVPETLNRRVEPGGG